MAGMKSLWMWMGLMAGGFVAPANLHGQQPFQPRPSTPGIQPLPGLGLNKAVVSGFRALPAASEASSSSDARRMNAVGSSESRMQGARQGGLMGGNAEVARSAARYPVSMVSYPSRAVANEEGGGAQFILPNGASSSGDAGASVVAMPVMSSSHSVSGNRQDPGSGLPGLGGVGPPASGDPLSRANFGNLPPNQLRPPESVVFGPGNAQNSVPGTAIDPSNRWVFGGGMQGAVPGTGGIGPGFGQAGGYPGMGQPMLGPNLAPPVSQMPLVPAPAVRGGMGYGDGQGMVLSSGLAWDTDRVWTFNFREAPWGVLLRDFAKAMGFSLTMGVEPQGTFTFFDDRRFSAIEAIDILNDHLIPNGAILIRNEQRLVVVSTREPINDNLVPFVAVNEIDLVGRNTVAGAAIPVRGMDPSIALAEVMAVKSSIGQVRPFFNSGRMLIIDTGTHLRRIRDLLLQTGFARSDAVSDVYQLRHAKAEDVAKAINDFLSNVSSDPMMQQGMSMMQMGQVDRVIAEKTTNSLLIRGSQESIPIITKLVCDLDRSPREVLLQALILEVQLGNTKEFGVELGLQDSVLFNRSIVNSIQTINQTQTAPNGVQTTNQTILSQTSTPGFNFNNQAIGNNTVNPGQVGKQSLSNLGVGRVNSDLGYGGLVLAAGSESVSALLRALDANFNIDVLSRPQVRTVENKEAFMQVGQQVPVVDGVTINAVGSANPVVRQDKAGIILKATPRISPDGRVQIDVNTEKSAFLLTKGSGVPIFTDAATGRVIEAPVKDITTASTTVSVQSGQTVVLGGMITNAENVVHRKVPFLGDLWLIGRFFRYDLNQHNRKELLVFLTPIVLQGDQHADELMLEEMEHTRISAPAQEVLQRWDQYRQRHGLVPGGVSDPACAPGEEVFSGERVLPAGQAIPAGETGTGN